MSMPALATIADTINAEHQAAQADARSALERARRCGELLLQAKAQVDHGGWLPWVEANLTFGVRQAQKYMRLADEWDRVANAKPDSHLEVTIDAALAAIADPRERVEVVEIVEVVAPVPAQPRSRTQAFDIVPAAAREVAPVRAFNVTPAASRPPESAIVVEVVLNPPSTTAAPATAGRREIIERLLPPKPPAVDAPRPSRAHVERVVAEVAKLLAGERTATYVAVILALIELLDDAGRTEVARAAAAGAVRRDVAALRAARFSVHPPASDA